MRSTRLVFKKCSCEQGTLNAERCETRLARLQERLEQLREQETDLVVTTVESEQPPTRKELAAVADQLEDVILNQPSERSKALLRLLVHELRVQSRAEIQPTYRVVSPLVCTTSEKVGGTGLEPVTPSLSSWCSPN
jgi:hypothetical protein